MIIFQENCLIGPRLDLAFPLINGFGPLKEQLLAVGEPAYLRRQGIFQADFMADMLAGYLRTGDGGPATGANYSRLIWAFFVFQQWYQNYFKG